MGSPAAETAYRESGAAVTPEAIQSYLDGLAAKNRGAETIKSYASKLSLFYQQLPEDKLVNSQSIQNWVRVLREKGYSPSTVNTHISAINGFLDFVGRRDLQFTDRLDQETEVQPELTRLEYLRLLSTARALGKERVYLLMKLIALTGVRVGEMPQVTAEAVQSGRILTTGGDGKLCYIPIPDCLRTELIDYIQRESVAKGPIFLSRMGKPMSRSVISGEIQRLGKSAQVEAAKCNPRCLRKLYQTTQQNMEAGVRLLVEQAQERMLEQEQLTIGWRATG